MFDIAIAGGGATGLTVALALRRLSGGALRVGLFDPHKGQPRGGFRASALAPGPRRMLEHLGAWSKLESLASPILTMQISDSRLEDCVRSTSLQFGAEPAAGGPLAHMVFHRDLEAQLAACAAASGVEIFSQRIVAYSDQNHAALVETDAGETIQARLVIAADGAGSLVRKSAGIDVLKWPYGRKAIVATIAHERDHLGCATQHFLPGGPFALLPLRGRRSSLVWTEPTDVAQRLLSSPKDEFLQEMERRAGFQLGAFAVEEGPASFDLAFQLARTFVAPRLALVGDAAHRVHPLAGQGLNLGFRDAGWLADLIMDQARLGLDVGSPDLLSNYQTARRFDSAFNAASFDLMHRLFALDVAPVRLMRDAGLAAVDRLDGVKRFFQREASGVSPGSPRLFSA